MTELLVKAICVGVAATLVYLTLRHPDRREKRNMTAYLILTVGSLAFWSLYQMAPSGLQLFAVNNVDLMVGSVQISAAMDSKYQHRRYRDWRSDTRGPFRPDAFPRLARRHPAAVCNVAALDGASVSYSSVRY